MRLEPERSLTLIGWWVALHALLAFAVALLPAPAAVTGCLAAALLIHAWRRFPSRPPVLVRARDGSWSLLDAHAASVATNLEAGAGSELAPGWVRLVLVGRGSRRTVVLLRDQLSPQSWRALQAVLRRP